MMQTVSPSYSSQIYSQTQNNRSTSAQGTESEKKQSSPDDPVALSGKGRQLSQESATSSQNSPAKKGDESAESSTKKAPAGQQNLSEEELQLITELQRRDTEVRAHEQAHLSAAGQYAAGGASFSFTTGPNGKRYAESGSVPIDVSKEKTPEATAQKMRIIQRAALAPANPSGADRGIAAQANAKEAQAMKEIQDLNSLSNKKKASSSPSGEQTPETESPKEKVSKEQTNSPQTPDYSRRTMASAYQAIAALAI